MIKKLLFLTLLLLQSSNIWANCPTGNVVFVNQNQVSEFLTQYPNCTQINGDLLLYSSIDISGLTNITSVTGDLRIALDATQSPANSLNGLQNITSVGGMLIVESPGLVNLNFLSSIQSVNSIYITGSVSDISALSGISGALSKGITITGAPNLASLNGLQNITSLGDRLFINGIPAVDLTGLQGITSITNSSDFPSTAVSIMNCNNLISFNGLHNLTTISATGTVATAGFSITSNNNLSDISALNNVTSTLNYVYIQFNGSLTNCAVNAFCSMLSISNSSINISSNNIGCGSNEEVLIACQNPDCPPTALIINSTAAYNAFVSQYPNCTQINGDLMIIGSELTTLAGLSGITQINGNITISGTSQLTNLNGLDNITSCNQLYIINNSGLTSLQGLNQLASEYLTYMGISNNQLLTNLDGLNNIQRVQSMNISDNPVLENINGLSGVSDRVELIYIQSNAALNSIAGLSQINSAGIIFLSVPSLTSLNGLNQLIEIGYNNDDDDDDDDDDLPNDRGGFNPGLFVFNTQIENVDALSNLTTLNGSHLYFEYNDALLNLNGLANLDGSSIGALALTNNPLLSNCAVSSICERIGIALEFVNTNIENNATGCEDVEAVETACELLSNQEISWVDAKIYPNPFVNQIQLQWNESLKGNIKLVDITGKILVEKSFDGQEFTIDQLDVLTSGVYFLQVNAINQKAKTYKIVK